MQLATTPRQRCLGNKPRRTCSACDASFKDGGPAQERCPKCAAPCLRVAKPPPPPSRKAAKRAAPSGAKGAPRSKGKGVFARAGGAVKKALGFAKKAPPAFGKRKSLPGLPAPKRTLAVSVPTASGNLGLFEARLNPATGVYEMEKPEGGHHAVQPHSKGRGSLMPTSKGGMVPVLTLGLSVLGGGALGMYLQTQPSVTLPILKWKVRRGVLAFLAALAGTIALRNKMPRVARHLGGLTAGLAAGMGAERVAAKRGLVTESA